MSTFPYGFPKDFKWGAATSAHQVEGGLTNDWTEWEKQNAHRLASESERSFGFLPSWPRIKDEALNPENYISGKASDHWHKYKQDYGLLEELNLNSYRLSFEWSRIEPQPGEFDEAALKHYQDMIADLKKRNIEPFVTLWHFTLPLWASERGGWESEWVVEQFEKYVKYVVKHFPHVHTWTTFNEIELYTGASYFTGDWPPQVRSVKRFWNSYHNMMKAHKRAYKAIKRINPKVQVGFSTNIGWYDSTGWYDRGLAWFANFWSNHYLLNKTRGTYDFIGLNYYFHKHFRFGHFFHEPFVNRSDIGWELYPLGIYRVLRELRLYKKPIYITESGLADATDSNRAWYIEECLKYTARAIDEGVDVRGYMHWSLLDNFEWDKGFWPKFGLAEVNYKTQKRRLRPSARHFAKLVAQARGLSS